MKYRVVLYDLPNGFPSLEGDVLDYRPNENAVKAAMMLYGAKRAEIVEITDESTDCSSGKCEM